MTARPEQPAAAAAPVPGLVSVVVVSGPGVEHTAACLRAVAELDWPTERLDLVVVTGAKERFAAMAAARGEYVALLAEYAQPERAWLRAAVDVLEREAGVAAVASRLVAGAGVSPAAVARPEVAWFALAPAAVPTPPAVMGGEVPRDVLFAAGTAMVVRAAAYRVVGGLDERFDGVLDDLDLGWRLNLLGHRVRYEPRSAVRVGATAPRDRPLAAEDRYLLERNALLTLYKNYDQAALAQVLPAAMALAVRRGSGTPETADATARAIDSFVDLLPAITTDRRRIQAARRRDDAQLRPLFREPLQPPAPAGHYRDGYDSVVDAFGLAERFTSRRRVLVVTSDTLTEQMAGPAIRAWEMARVLSAEHEVELATLGACAVSHPDFRCHAVTGRELRRLVGWCDILVFQGFLLVDHPWVKDSDAIIVVDVYDPFHLEALEQSKDLAEPLRASAVDDSIRAVNEQFLRGDFFVCASGKQRDFWLGQLSALGRVNPLTYDDDETLHSLIAVAPFGLSPRPPVHRRKAVKGVVEGIGPTDKLVLWGGGIWNWFDPLTLLRAVDRLRHRQPDVRLFFLGTKSPNPLVPEMRMAVAARQLSDSLGLTGRYVFFNEGWVSYNDRQNYLLEADVGVSAHLDHVETAFSFRTRILDYLWAGLPVVTTSGDVFGDLVEAEGLGAAVPPGEVAALEEALFRLLADGQLAAACRARVRTVAPRFTWPNALAPLLDFCREPHRAADLARSGSTAASQWPPIPGAAGAAPAANSWRSDVELFRQYLRRGGVAEVGRRAYGRLRRRPREPSSHQRAAAAPRPHP